MMTYRELLDNFNENIRPAVIEQYGPDEPALNEAWNNYTDAECKDGQINGLVYHHCPALDGDNWPDDTEAMIEFLMAENGISVNIEVDEHPDDFFDQAGARHFRFGVEDSGGRTVYTGHYSQGPGIRSEPTEAGIFSSILMDCSSADQDFEDWCADLDDDDSIKALRAWEACKAVHQRIAPLLGAEHFDDWLELAHEV